MKPFFDAQILLVVDEIFVHEKSSDRICCPHKPSIDIFFVIKVIISNNKFIAFIPFKFGARFSFSDFHGQKFSQQQEPGLREKITKNMINI